MQAGGYLSEGATKVEASCKENGVPHNVWVSVNNSDYNRYVLQTEPHNGRPWWHYEGFCGDWKLRYEGDRWEVCYFDEDRYEKGDQVISRTLEALDVPLPPMDGWMEALGKETFLTYENPHRPAIPGEIPRHVWVEIKGKHRIYHLQDGLHNERSWWQSIEANLDWKLRWNGEDRWELCRFNESRCFQGDQFVSSTEEALDVSLPPLDGWRKVEDEAVRLSFRPPHATEYKISQEAPRFIWVFLKGEEERYDLQPAFHNDRCWWQRKTSNGEWKLRWDGKDRWEIRFHDEVRYILGEQLITCTEEALDLPLPPFEGWKQVDGQDAYIDYSEGTSEDDPSESHQ